MFTVKDYIDGNLNSEAELGYSKEEEDYCMPTEDFLQLYGDKACTDDGQFGHGYRVVCGDVEMGIKISEEKKTSSRN